MATPTKATLTAIQGEFEIKSQFSNNFWGLLHDVPTFYNALLNSLGRFGVSLSSVRIEGGDGTLGGVNVSTWLVDFGYLLKIHIDGVTLSCPRTDRVDLSGLTELLAAVDSLVIGLTDIPCWRSHVASVSVHAKTSESPREITSRFVNTPNFPPKSIVGSGFVVYFTPKENVAQSGLTVDLSAISTEALFVKYSTTLVGDIAMAAVPTMVSSAMSTALNCVGFELADLDALI
ncbi:MAG: hypothetical protein Q7R30_15660 [Acidobacteriota bacterium]|nr:hypothetical protein [Acidobacteriota bacterium]